MLADILYKIVDLIWNNYFIFFFLIMGVVFSVLTRFVQITHLKDMFRLLFKSKATESGISSFQAISMTLGGRIGTGNIAGVATAIAFGGPGAVFWMWVTAFLGSSTAFIENTLGQIYKSKIDGEYRGGMPFYIKKGLGLRKVGILVAIATIIGNGFFLMTIQSNTISASFESALGVPAVVTGIIVVALLAVIIIGGVKRIAKAAELMIPIMGILYVAVCGILLITHWNYIGEVFMLIINSAFGLDATFGGLVGSAVSWGVQRGVFSNGAGHGMETFEGSAAEVDHPAEQGLVNALAVYIDTWIICSATAFMILVTGMFNVESGGITNIPGIEAGSGYVQLAVESTLTGFGSIFLAISLFFFCFTTMMAYYYKTETCFAYIKEDLNLGNTSFIRLLVKCTIILFAFIGTVVSMETAWAFGDVGIGGMAYINVIALIFLVKPALSALKDYNYQKQNPNAVVTFDPVKIGIKGADYWEKKLQEKNNEAKDERKAE
ncbi:alanine/glycine:cation symporter family protein [Oceanobacillus jeddahense]|uniref:alanine/glycine:cation symporter family protein n=1 Tax=Oceanobacillus jeddahense TaxID=1462527 RepID=UPI003625FD55